jgi:hypothetical protein
MGSGFMDYRNSIFATKRLARVVLAEHDDFTSGIRNRQKHSWSLVSAPNLNVCNQENRM